MVDAISNIKFNTNIKLGEIHGYTEDDVSIFSSSASVDAKSNNMAKTLSDAWSEILSKAEVKKRAVSQGFFKELIKFAGEIKVDPIDLAFIMFKESRFDPKNKNGDYFGLIQMDSTAFNDCALRMLEYEKYCKDHPKENLTIRDYIKKTMQKGFKKPNIGSARITFAQYKNLSREKQIKYAEAYLKYRIHEKGLNGKRIPSNQLWALIHRPADYNKTSELRERENKLQKVKNEIKSLYPQAYRKIVNSKTFSARG